MNSVADARASCLPGSSKIAYPPMTSLVSTKGPSTTLKPIVRYAHLRAGGERRQSAIVEHAAGLDLSVGELVHRLHERSGVGGPEWAVLTINIKRI